MTTNFVGVGLGCEAITVTPSPATPESFAVVTLTFSDAPNSVTLLGPDGSDQSGLLAGSGTSYGFTPTQVGAYTAGAVAGGTEVGSTQVIVGIEGLYLALLPALDCSTLTLADWTAGGDGVKTDSDGNDWQAIGTGDATALGPDGVNGIKIQNDTSVNKHVQIGLELADYAGDEDAEIIYQWLVSADAMDNPGAPFADTIYSTVNDDVTSAIGGNFGKQSYWAEAANDYTATTSYAGATSPADRGQVGTVKATYLRFQRHVRGGEYWLYMEATAVDGLWDPSSMDTTHKYFADTIDRRESVTVKTGRGGLVGWVALFRNGVTGSGQATIRHARILQR